MQQPAQEARPRHRSAFAAAFLSLIFPGLGHAYAGAWNRALGFAAVPILVLALMGGVALSSGIQVFGAQLVANLPLLLGLNLVFMAYRVVAAVDAYRVAAYLNAVDASGGGRFGRPSLRLDPLSLAGLIAVCLVIAGGHGLVAAKGAEAQAALSCIFVPEGAADTCDDSTDTPEPGTSADAVASPSGTTIARHDERSAARDPAADRRPPAVERQGPAQHPAHRRRPAAEGEHVQHRHADRRVDRSDHEAGRDVQPAP